MQKEKGIVSIKVKLLGVIVPVVIVSILVLVLIAYRTSAGLIESYSENLLESSVENQASQIERLAGTEYRGVPDSEDNDREHEAGRQGITDHAGFLL